MNAVDFVKRLSPITIALDRTQRNCTTIAIAVEIWHTLHLEFEEQPIKIRCFTEGNLMALYGAHCAANTIDHTFLSKNLSNAEKKKVLNTSTKLKNMVSLLKSDPFPVLLFNIGSHIKNNLPLLWWAVLGRQTSQKRV